MAETFHVVAATSELADEGQMFVELDGHEILLCKHEGNYYAVAYYCSHAEFSLEGGSMHKGCIICPYHGAEFRLADGAVTASPAYEPIRVYPVKIEDNTIAIGVQD